VIKKKIFIVRLIGGLGNQLFQMQYAHYLLKNYEAKILFDDSFLKASKKTHESISFHELFKDKEIVTLPYSIVKLKRFIERVFFKLKISHNLLLNPVFIFNDSQLPGYKNNIYIFDGFWQNKKFLTNDFLFFVRNKLPKINIPDDSPVVCLHIRRGDYLTNKNWGKNAQLLLPIAYYRSAINFFISKFSGSVKFEIFTDDELWAYQHFCTDDRRFSVVESSQLSPSELLGIMSSYSNFIIANSTLSWWAAVLSDSFSKIVIAPKVWGPNKSSIDYLLDDWISI
jgi:hypothetical protein